MTHRGPFQPLPFCDSVILYNKQMWSSCSRLYKRGKKALFVAFFMSKFKEGVKNSSPKNRHFLLDVCMLAFLGFLKHSVDKLLKLFSSNFCENFLNLNF